MTKPWFALGWQCGQLTGWGQFGAHFARTCTEAGYRVILPAIPDTAGVLPLDRPLLNSLVGPIPETEPGWLLMAIGNAMEERPQGLPDHIKVAGIIFCEDTGAIDAAKLNAYDVIVAGSRWTERVLREKGVERVVLAHQGYDSRVFFPAPVTDQPCDYFVKSREMRLSIEPGEIVGLTGGYSDIVAVPKRRRPIVFSGGKLEFRKGQDIVVEAFKRFRQTPEGKDAILVTAWDNQWPQTMDGIWLSGYVKGVPKVTNGRAGVVPWLVANGLPADSVIDCGRLSPPELAHVMRSCTVGIFPNRAESGTNLVLVEALASGLPCVMAGVHGQSDSADHYAPVPPWLLQRAGTVPSGCPLYRSTEGWTEPDHEEVVEGLRFAFDAPRPTCYADYWSWSVRGPAMAEAILESATVPA